MPWHMLPRLLFSVRVLVHAGIWYEGTILEQLPAQIEKTIQTNLLANFWTAKAFLPDMMKRYGAQCSACACQLNSMLSSACGLLQKFRAHRDHLIHSGYVSHCIEALALVSLRWPSMTLVVLLTSHVHTAFQGVSHLSAYTASKAGSFGFSVRPQCCYSALLTLIKAT